MNHRRSVRLQGYDYSKPGAYFATLVTANRACLFGEVAGGEMVLNECGRRVEFEWRRTFVLRPYLRSDEYVIMPNHFHGILWIVDVECRGTVRRAPTAVSRIYHTPTPDRRVPKPFGKPAPGSLSTILRSFKSAVTKQVREHAKNPEMGVWQRNYYERVIRNDAELNRIRQYIVENPVRWEMDPENPAMDSGSGNEKILRR